MSGEEIGITASKEENFSEWYTQVVLKAEIADYAPVKGLIVLRPDGYAIWELLKNRVDARLSQRGVKNGFLPTLIPESLLGAEKEHFAGFNPEVFWVTHSGDNPVGDRLALRPTSETLAYPLYSKWIKSWRDLPLKMNFWNTALRAEIKGTKPFLRTSEFLWQEGHTVHATEKEAMEEVDAILEIYKQTVEEVLAIPVIPGRKSDGEKFVGAVYTTTIESMMPDGRALQMGTSHFLGQNFAKPFGVKFADRNNTERFAWQTSWGVSWRLLGAMIMTHGDGKGLVLPPKVAPVQVVVIPIRHKTEGVMEKAQEIAEELKAEGVRALVDSRDELTPGFKFNHWELKGVPLRMELGPRDIRDSSAVLASRLDGNKSSVPLEEITDRVKIELDAIQARMLASARRMLDENVREAVTYGELADAAARGGFVRAPWCGAEKCEEKIKEEIAIEIRVIPFADQEKPGACVACGSQGTTLPLFARGY